MKTINKSLLPYTLLSNRWTLFVKVFNTVTRHTAWSTHDNWLDSLCETVADNTYRIVNNVTFI